MRGSALILAIVIPILVLVSWLAATYFFETFIGLVVLFWLSLIANGIWGQK